LDEVWYCAPDERVRITNLIARHRAYGKSEEAARRWALGSDQHNAELIATTRSQADLIVTLDAQLGDDLPHVEPSPCSRMSLDELGG
jgi:hypothetical protein